MTLASLLRRYLDDHGGTGTAAGRVRLTQTGEIQLKPGRWIPFGATQEISVEQVAFNWQARFRLAPLLSLEVVDWYRDGDGGLEGRLWGRLPLMQARGDDVARGEAMRYLAELPWAPTAIGANPELEWREVDGVTFEVSTEVAGSRAAVRLHLDEAGDIIRVTAEARPRRIGKQTVETPFTGSFGGYESLGSLRVPTTAEATWELPEGPFTYFRGRLRALEVFAV